MNFINEVKALCKGKEKVLMFVDMDGTIVEYDYCPEQIKNYVPGKFLKQRPLHSIIKVIKAIKDIPNIELYILSACNFNKQAAEKDIWLNENTPFFAPDKRIFVVKENEDYEKNDKKEMKAIYIASTMKKEKADYAIFIDDNHEYLKKTAKYLQDKVTVFHPSSLVS